MKSIIILGILLLPFLFTHAQPKLTPLKPNFQSADSKRFEKMHNESNIFTLPLYRETQIISPEPIKAIYYSDDLDTSLITPTILTIRLPQTKQSLSTHLWPTQNILSVKVVSENHSATYLFSFTDDSTFNKSKFPFIIKIDSFKFPAPKWLIQTNAPKRPGS